MRTLPYPRPDWIKRISGSWNTPRTAEALMRIVLDVAHAGVIKGFGPFAAALCDRSGRIIELNVNQVTAAHDCSAHGEAVVMRNSQALLSTNTKPCVDLHDYTLYTSSQPCVSCSGQIWAFRPQKVVWVLHTPEVETLAPFSEGRVATDFWVRAKRERQISKSTMRNRELRNYAAQALVLFCERVEAGLSKSYLQRL